MPPPWGPKTSNPEPEQTEKTKAMSGPIPQPGILDIAPYVGGESSIPGVDRIIKLASNEGALGPSPLASKAFAALSGELHRYPDGGCSRLRETIGTQEGLDPERIVCGAGSDELLSLLCQAYAGEGDEVLHSQHGFLMYPISARSVGAIPIAAAETNLTTSVDALLGCVTDKTRILFLANPNNPTGTYLPRRELARLRAGLREDILLVIDAAYAEFVERDDYTVGSDLVDAGNNVVMTRTFSKMFALGGLRLGWAYCPPSIADILNRVRGPFNVAAPSIAAGVAAFTDTDFTRKVRDHNNRWLNWTRDELRKLGLWLPEDGVGNFLLVRFPKQAECNAEAANAYLRQQGIIVRLMAGYGLPDCLRISIGREDEMRAVVDAVSQFMGQNS